MLYERWRQIADASPNELALHDLGSARQWTFRELALAGEKGGDDGSKAAFPQGISAEFILAVLRAWRSRRVVCPLEPGQSELALPGKPPDEVVHLKTTSASTGEARIIAFTAAQLVADAENV